MSELTLYELPPSPNNMKVRVGLGFKGLQFERSVLKLDAFPGDRTRAWVRTVLAHDPIAK